MSAQCKEDAPGDIQRDRTITRLLVEEEEEMRLAGLVTGDSLPALGGGFCALSRLLDSASRR
jgi:hypothetical protein